MSSKNVFFLLRPGPRPPFARIAEHLWGVGVDFDSDGDSSKPGDTLWTELTIQRRSAYDQRVDVDPVSKHPLVLKVFSDVPSLADRVATYLATHCGATLLREWPSTKEEA